MSDDIQIYLGIEDEIPIIEVSEDEFSILGEDCNIDFNDRVEVKPTQDSSIDKFKSKLKLIYREEQ